MQEQATGGLILALIALAYLRPGRVDALGRFRDSQQALVIAGLVVAVLGNSVLVAVTEPDNALFRDPSWAVVLPLTAALVIVGAAVSVRSAPSSPERMNAPVAPGRRELIGVPSICALYALLALWRVVDVGRGNRAAFDYAPPLPPAVTDRYVNEPLPTYESYVAEGWVVAVACAVVAVALTAMAAAQGIVRRDDPDRPGVAQHVARLGAAAALIAGTGTALLAAGRIDRIGAENTRRYESAQVMLREAGVSFDALVAPRNLTGASSSLENVANLPNLIGWTLLLLVIGRVFVTNGIRRPDGEFNPPVR
ncbi:hypothetical protein TSST111916_00715 [Tsukamurella strandjordii]|uniref:hypothetical protein n=1 Tax=Tsukamurella TaxID=2060 RepID=UPI001C7D98DA|nr:hypothetical protein [Tsukamurella sp. TY48]GIZ98876.1 hypothetical protein TTY48_34880 [Tsukamurella sp. TY48]